MRKQESPEKRAIRDEANKKYMQSVRDNESWEEKVAKCKKRMEAWRNKLLNETEEEMADRKRKNMLYQRQYRQHETGFRPKKRRREKRAPASTEETETESEKRKEHEMTDLLMKVAGFKSDCLKMRPCLYVSKPSSV